MAQIQFASRSMVCKLVYYGPGLAGKTTNLEFIYHKAPPEQRGELTSIATTGDRTIVFDFLPIEVGKVSGLRVTLQLYTVPGQPYYAATRKLVLTGVDGVVFVADSQALRMKENIESLEELRVQLRDQGKDLADFPLVFQWNKRDLPECASIAELQRALNPGAMPAFEASAAKGEGVLATLKMLSKLVLTRCREDYAGDRPSAAFVPRHPTTDLETRTRTRSVVAPNADSDPASDPLNSLTPALDADSTLEWGEDPEPAIPGHSIGDVVGGCVILAKLGEGGMGTAYVARHKNNPKETVVVKTLKPGKEVTKKRVKRFFREARSAARLDHENVVRVQEVGTDERGMHYMIMQHVQGVNLREHVEQRGPLEPLEAARILLEVARALEASHREGVIHRDVKPENVVIGSRGDVKLIDFGLARDMHAEDELTRSGGVVGTIMYMAPEMFLGREADERSDVFSLGLTFYFMLTAQQPFEGRKANEVISGVARLHPPGQFAGCIPGRVEAVLERMLERNPRGRYQGAPQLIEDLEALWSRAGPGAASQERFWLWDASAEVEAIPSDGWRMGRGDTGRHPPLDEPTVTAVRKSPYSREVLSALDAWDTAREEDHESSEEIARLVDSAWGEAESWGSHVKAPEDSRPASSKSSARVRKAKELLGASWKRDLKRALAKIEVAEIKSHRRKRLSRDPGQAEVNALLRLGPQGRTEKARRGSRRGGSRQTVSELTRAIKKNRKHPQPWTKRGIARARGGDLAGAIADYTRALELDPNYLPALANRGSAHFHLQSYAEAEADCDLAIKRAPRLAKAWLFRGISRAVLSRPGAREDMLRFLRLSPFSPYVHYIRLLLKGKVGPQGAT